MKINKLITFALALGFAVSGFAQMTMSPYSRFGYGILSDNATAAQRQMGGVGYAMNSGRQINVMNPASYARMDSLTFLFDMGVDLTVLKSHEGILKESQTGGGLDYITMQVPIGKRMGASVGLLPYGSTGYAFGSSIDNGAASRSGSGSINQLYLGFGGSPINGLSLGFNIGYLFGSTTNDLYAYTNAGSTSLFERVMRVQDWHLDLGIQYTVKLDRKNSVTAGLVYSPRKTLHGEAYGLSFDTSTPSQVDTLTVGGATNADGSKDIKMHGQFSIPETWGAGLAWQYNQRLHVEFDFTYQPWSKARFGRVESFETTRFADRYRGALGAQWQPAVRGAYLHRIQYRVGGFYERDYVMVGTNHLRSYGLGFGFGLPVPGFKTIVSLGFDWRRRQATPEALIKEDFFNITLGVNFNEMWFRKSKIY